MKMFACLLVVMSLGACASTGGGASSQRDELIAEAVRILAPAVRDVVARRIAERCATSDSFSLCADQEVQKERRKGRKNRKGK